ncbi:Gfo/Idh/MocA family protein [Yoonia sp.]|uniref:Gfo/Idh/MocA family protein n=1 Tax=Yoonia sp. TaxID=2212373 RepID=UPI003A4E2921
MTRVLIVGTGGMANAHVEAYRTIPDVQVVGGVDTSAENLAAFCEQWDVPHRFASVNDALAWGEFDAVSNVTPDAVHHRTTMPLLAAGKHVLCEKPLAINHADATDMAQAAQAAGVVNMVNLTYRNVPALIHAADLIAQGAIGEVRHFEASYLQSWLVQPAWGDWQTEDQWLWRLSSAHGSMGVLGDVGVHIVDYATFAAGSDVARVSCRLKTFAKAAGDRIGPYHLDANDSMSMHLALQNGATGVLHASRFAAGHHNDLTLRIFGTKGGLKISFEKATSHLTACLGDDLLTGHWTDVETPAVQTNYARFIAAIRDGQPVGPDFARGAALQRVLDAAVVSDINRSSDQEV